MPIPDHLKNWLEKQGVPFTIYHHPNAFTAQEEAAAAHISGKHYAKAVVLKVEDRFVLAVIPADKQLNMKELTDLFGGKAARLAREEEFRDRFVGCEIGAIPPFGELYGMEMVLDPALKWERKIAFSGGLHSATIEMIYSDFERLAHPRFATLTA